MLTQAEKGGKPDNAVGRDAMLAHAAAVASATDLLVGSGLARCALGAFLRAASEMREHGTFTLPMMPRSTAP